MGRRPFVWAVATAVTLLAASGAAALFLGAALAGCYVHFVPLPDVPLCAVSLWGTAWMPVALLGLCLTIFIVATAGAIRGGIVQFGGAARLERQLADGATPAASNPALARAVEDAGVTAEVYMCERSPLAAVTVGVRRPRIYVSGWVSRSLGPDALAAVLAHEQSHAQRRDPLVFGAARAASLVAWPLPILRDWAERTTLDAELRADAHATATFGQQALLSALYDLLSEPGPATPVATGAITSMLDQRLLAMDGCQEPMPLTTRRVVISSISIGAMTAVLAALVSVTARAGWVLP